MVPRSAANHGGRPGLHDKLAALEGEGGDPEVLKDYFHNTPTADIIGDIAIKDTFGHGTYGRVRRRVGGRTRRA